MSDTRGKKAGGFTLVELIVLIGIFALLTAMTVPNVARYVRSNQLETTAQRMAADLNLARSMSISTGQVFQVASTVTGYQLIEVATGRVVQTRNFEGDVRLAAGDTVNFFPWGMADAANFDFQGVHGNRAVNLLPTGIVEVQ
jgi:type II secretion system protein H